MAELPYVISTGKIPEYFGKIQEVGVPSKLDQAWLKSIGFTSSNDRYLAAFLKDLGFASSSGEPTQTWKDYRHKTHAPSVLGQAIRKAYGGLFDTYSDADKKDEEAIRNWMRTAAPSASPTTVSRAVGSFRAICTLATFDDVQPDPAQPTQVTPHAPTSVVGTPLAQVVNQHGVTISLNVELQLPSSATAEDYDNFFAAMRKHLIDGPSEAS